MLKNNCDIVDYYRNKLTLNMAGALLYAAGGAGKLINGVGW